MWAAIGTAASKLGPRAVARATQLNKGAGPPNGKTAAVLLQAFSLQASRRGLRDAMDRVGGKAEPTYEACWSNKSARARV
jgi:hypothetical protein